MSSLPVVFGTSGGEKLQVLNLIVRVLLASEQSGGELTIIRTEDPPRSGPPLHVHTRENESFYVIEGEYLLQVGDKQHKLRPGDFAFGPRNFPHTYANAGTTTGSLLVASTPGGFERFFRETDALAKAGDASPEALVPVGERYGIQFLGPPLLSP